MIWHILTTTPRHEFIVAGHLIGHGVTAYCPTYQVVKRRGPSAKRVTVDMPLFPGYLFAMASDATAKAVHASPGCRGYLTGPEGPKLISDAAVASIRIFEEELRIRRKHKPEVRRFHPGDMVRIAAAPDYHPCAGFEAMVQRLDKHDRATLLLMMHGRSWLVVSPAHWLEPIPRSA